MVNIHNVFPSKYLKAGDLDGHAVAVTISHIAMEEVGQGDVKPVLFFAGKEKGLVLNKTNGGVIANRTLRERLMEVCARSNIHCAVPAMNLCTDNGAMVAGLGVHLNSVLLHEVAVVPNLPLERCA